MANADQQHEPISVAVIEDQAMWRDVFEGAVKASSYLRLVGSAGTLAEARALLLTTRPRVVILDLFLNDEHGLDLCRDLGILFERSRWIVVTSNARPIMVRNALRAGAHGIVAKGTDTIGVLEQAILRVSGGGEYYTAKVAEVMAALLRAEPELRLSAQEERVLEGLANRKSPKEIAFDLGIGVGAVNSYIVRIRDKLDVDPEAPADIILKHAFALGLIIRPM